MTVRRLILVVVASLAIFGAGVAAFTIREADRLSVPRFPVPERRPLEARSPAEPGSTPIGAGAIGTSAVHAGIRYTLLSIVDPEPPGRILVPIGRRRIGIQLRLEPENGPAQYNTTLLRLRASDGADYSWAFTNQSPALRLGTLQPGEAVTGWVAFDLPGRLEPVAIHYGTGTDAVVLFSLR